MASTKHANTRWCMCGNIRVTVKYEDSLVVSAIQETLIRVSALAVYDDLEGDWVRRLWCLGCGEEVYRNNKNGKFTLGSKMLPIDDVSNTDNASDVEFSSCFHIRMVSTPLSALSEYSPSKHYGKLVPFDETLRVEALQALLDTWEESLLRETKLKIQVAHQQFSNLKGRIRAITEQRSKLLNATDETTPAFQGKLNEGRSVAPTQPVTISKEPISITNVGSVGSLLSRRISIVQSLGTGGIAVDNSEGRPNLQNNHTDQDQFNINNPSSTPTLARKVHFVEGTGLSSLTGKATKALHATGARSAGTSHPKKAAVEVSERRNDENIADEDEELFGMDDGRVQHMGHYVSREIDEDIDDDDEADGGEVDVQVSLLSSSAPVAIFKDARLSEESQSREEEDEEAGFLAPHVIVAKSYQQASGLSTSIIGKPLSAQSYKKSSIAI